MDQRLAEELIYISQAMLTETECHIHSLVTRPPPGYRYDHYNTKTLLAGSGHFTPSEIEVYYYA